MTPGVEVHQVSLLRWLSDPPADRGLRLRRPDGGWDFHSYQRLAELTRRAAARLRGAGVSPGDTVLLVRAASPEMVADFFGTLLLGATPAPVAPPAGIRYAERLPRAVRLLRPRVVATTPAIAPVVAAYGAAVVTDVPADGPSLDDPAEPPRIGLTQLASGSTGRPHVVRIPFAALESHVAAIHRWLGVTADDGYASFLPPHHGMGLLDQVLLPTFGAATVSVLPPGEFIRSPRSWLRCFDAGGATLSVTPAAGLAHLVRRLREERLGNGLDLTGWRAVVVAAQRIDPKTVDEFLRLLAPHGVTDRAIVAAYGLAEPALAITGSRCGAGPTTVTVDAPSPGAPVRVTGGRGTRLVGRGAPIDGLGVRVVDRRGDPVDEGTLGEIEVRGDPLASAHPLRTGDAGFWYDGQLFVTGRVGAGFDAVAAGPVFTQVRRHLPARLAIATKLAGNGAVEVGGAGCRVHLSDGRVALDFGSYAVTLLGHRHPAVVDAVRRQLDTLPTATRLLANPWTAKAAERLAEHLGGRLNRVWFGANGSDAVDAAVKLALIASGRNRILAVDGAFHGKTLGVLGLTHHDRYRAGRTDFGYRVTHLPADDPDAATRELARGDVAALLFEPVQGENGVRTPDAAVLAAWCAAAVDGGAFVIADEIQTGLRRCGERSVALAAGLPVDAVLLGKPLAGGVLPMSAVVCDERLYAPLLADPMLHTATFAGHPLASAVVPVALDAIEELAGRCAPIATAMAAGLTELARAHPGIVRAVRGRGLLWGLELASASMAGDLVPRLARNGLLVSPCMGRPSTLRLLPPIVVGDAEVTEALDIVAASLRDLDADDRRRAEAAPAVAG